jgi:catechol O-methyltransferase
MPEWRCASGLMLASTTSTRLVGTVAGSGLIIGALAKEHGFATGRRGVLFVDHDTAHTCPTCRASWKVVGCAANPSWSRTEHPESDAEVARYMKQHQGALFDTVEHKTCGEYQTLVPDIVLESGYLCGWQFVGDSLRHPCG